MKKTRECPFCLGCGVLDVDFKGQDFGCTYCDLEKTAIDLGRCIRGEEYGFESCGVKKKEDTE